MTSIEDYAFNSCTGLPSVTSLILAPFAISESAFYQCPALTTLYVPFGTKALYEATEGWSKNFKNIVEMEEDKENINFADALVKSICVANWDTDGDGELSKDEAAAVTTVGDVFKGKAITSFDELQYFTGLAEISDWAFYNCGKLKSIVLPETITSIGENALTWCESLLSLNIPAAVTSIGGSAFAGLKSLQTLTVDAASQSFVVDDDVLYTKDMKTLVFCPPLLKSGTFTVKSTVKELAENCFYLCDKLTAIILNEGLEIIGGGAFVGCSMQTLHIPASVLNVGYDYECQNLRSFTVDAANTHFMAIDGVLFMKNPMALIAYPKAKGNVYTIPDGTTDTQIWAFVNSPITEVTLPASMKMLRAATFGYCNDLQKITVMATTPPTCPDNAIVFYQSNAPQQATLYVPFGTKDLYEAANIWKDFQNIVEMENETDVPVTIVANDYTREYGEENPDFDFTIAEGEIQSGAPEVSCAATKSSPVGTYDIIITKGTVSNKEVTLVRGTLTITKAPLTVKAGDYTIMEGEEIPQFVPTYEGFKLNETKVVLTVQPTVTCSATKYSGPGEYEVVVSGGEAQNYALSYVNGRLVIGVNPNLFSEGSIQYELLSNGSVAVVGGDSAEGDVVIPETVDHDGETYTVTEIAEDAFANNTAMTSVTIPETITAIGAGAFAGCTGLRDIFIYVPIPIDLSVAQARGLIQNAEGEKVPAFDGVDKESCVLHVPFGCGEAYRNAPIWGDFKNIVEMADPSGISAVDRSQLTSGKWYDLQGRMIKIEDGGLKPGIYIVNGRKVVMK